MLTQRPTCGYRGVPRRAWGRASGLCSQAIRYPPPTRFGSDPIASLPHAERHIVGLGLPSVPRRRCVAQFVVGLASIMFTNRDVPRLWITFCNTVMLTPKVTITVPKNSTARAARFVA